MKDTNLATVKEVRASTSLRGLQNLDLPKILTGATHVFHLAGQAGVRKKREAISTSIAGTTFTRPSAC